MVFEFIFIIFIGLSVGSFLNVCIHRLPLGESLIRPSSRCPYCRNAIRPLDNIPVLSYILLKGRCRNCGSRISLRYPLVESLNALLYIFALMRFGFGLQIIPYLILISALIVITFIDLDHMIIPDVVTLPLSIAGVLISGFLLIDPFSRMDPLGIKSSLIGLFTGFVLFYLISEGGRYIFKKEAMGGGDIKMMAMVGSFTGWKGVIMTTFFGSLIGSITGIILMTIKKRTDTTIPFGPYLALGTLITIFFGEEIFNILFPSIWY